jgi:hypothetical protein
MVAAAAVEKHLGRIIKKRVYSSSFQRTRNMRGKNSAFLPDEGDTTTEPVR